MSYLPVVAPLLLDVVQQNTQTLLHKKIEMTHETYMISSKAKQKYRGMNETPKFGNKTSSGEIGLDIRTHASPKVGQDQVSGGVSVLCWHAALVANVLWNPHTIR